MPNESKVQLLLERAGKALILAYEIFPADFPIYCAHEAELRDETKPSYLDLIAAFPLWNGACWSSEVTIQLLTDIADDSTRLAQTDLHASRLGDLRDLFSDANFKEALALMNAPIVAGIGFTGWEPPAEDEQGDDGPAESGRQLVARPKFVFDCHLLF